jgi:hypothetical protein
VHRGCRCTFLAAATDIPPSVRHGPPSKPSMKRLDQVKRSGCEAMGMWKSFWDFHISIAVLRGRQSHRAEGGARRRTLSSFYSRSSNRESQCRGADGDAMGGGTISATTLTCGHGVARAHLPTVSRSVSCQAAVLVFMRVPAGSTERWSDRARRQTECDSSAEREQRSRCDTRVVPLRREPTCGAQPLLVGDCAKSSSPLE